MSVLFFIGIASLAPQAFAQTVSPGQEGPSSGSVAPHLIEVLKTGGIYPPADASHFDGVVKIGGAEEGLHGILEMGNSAQLKLQDITTVLKNSALVITVPTYKDGWYFPGLVWGASNANPTLPQMGIWGQMFDSGSQKATKMYFGTSNDFTKGITNQAVTIDQSGQVGIGTTSPNAKLEVNGSMKMTGRWIVPASGPWSGDYFEVHTSGWDGSSNNSYGGVAAGHGYYYGGLQSGGNSGNEAGGGELYVSRKSMLLGNVGIGTTQPWTKLDVVGGVRITGTTPDGENLRVGGIRGNLSSANGSNQLIHLFNNVNIGYPGGWGGQDAPQYGLSVYGGANLGTNQGNVGIGTASPAAKLDVENGMIALNNPAGGWGDSDQMWSYGPLAFMPDKDITGDPYVDFLNPKDSSVAVRINTASGEVKASDFCIGSTCASSGGFSPWAKSGSDIYNTNAGSVTVKAATDNVLNLQTTDNKWLYTQWLASDGTRRAWMGLDSDLSWFYIQPENGTKGVVLGGNVGIGTPSPQKPLDVAGDARIGNTADRHYLEISSKEWPEIRFSTPSRNSDMRIGMAHEANSYYGVNEGDFYIYSPQTNRMDFMALRNGGISLVPKGGNVGIGTASPKNKLHVVGAIGATDWVGAGCETDCSTDAYAIMYPNGNVTTYNGDSTSPWYYNQLHFSSGWGTDGRHATIGSGYSGISAAGIMLGTPHVPWRSGFGAKVRFASDQNASAYWDWGMSAEDGGSIDRFDLRRNNSQLLTVTSGGSVGIGTTDPKGKLDIESNKFYSYDSSISSWGQPQCSWDDDTYSKNSPPSRATGALGSTCYDWEWKGRNNITSYKYIVKTSSFIVDTSGNVGIGTTNPGTNYKLDVNGIINAKDVFKNGASLVGSQWVSLGTHIYYNMGNVGVNTGDPKYALDMNGFFATGGSKANLANNTGTLINLKGTGRVLIGWNLTGKNGETDFISDRTNGGGGFAFYDYDGANTKQLLTIDGADGSVNIGSTVRATRWMAVDDSSGAAYPRTFYNSNSVHMLVGVRDADNIREGQIGLTTNHPLTFYTNNKNRMQISANGNVGIGVDPSDTARLNVGGNVNVAFDTHNSRFVTKDAKLAYDPQVQGFDIAENFETDKDVESGDVLVTSQINNTLTPSSKPYQKGVIGVVSTSPAILFEGSTMKLAADLKIAKGEKPPVALSGRVPVKVSLENGPIKSGDYLTTSNTSGYAMKATNPGPTIGIALEDYSTKSSGAKIMMLVNLAEGNMDMLAGQIQELRQELERFKRGIRW